SQSFLHSWMSQSSYSTAAGNELLPMAGSRRGPGMAELFARRQKDRRSITPDQALAHMCKVMMGTGMLSLPLAFKHSGLWLGMALLPVLCAICIYCTRQLVFAQHYIGYVKSQQKMDYANVMRAAVELGPVWIREKGYIFKQVVNFNMFVAQLGFCSVYFVFMADNLKQFFDQTSTIHISQAGWIGMLLIPILALCTIRELKALAPLAAMANVVYIVAVCIVLHELFSDLQPSSSLPAAGRWEDLPLFFGTVMFAFEGVAVVLPIENEMDEPIHFITANGVLNTSCFLVLILYSTVGFFGYLRFGDGVLDTITLNLPQTTFYQTIKVMFVSCVMVSYPLQFYVPMERIEKWIHRKIVPARQEFLIYFVRFSLVIITCLVAELIPHLALFISLVGSIASTSLTLVFPPLIELLCYYSRGTLTYKIWIRNIILLCIAVIGFATGTYASLKDIIKAFGQP
ncbi:slc-36.2, partial [Pristionchus pacificus]